MNDKPVWKTPAFWRACAEEWRGPTTENTRRGICLQLLRRLPETERFADASNFLYTFNPTADAKGYFFKLEDRASRAALCDHIATLCDHIATCLENETNQA